MTAADWQSVFLTAGFSGADARAFGRICAIVSNAPDSALEGKWASLVENMVGLLGEMVEGQRREIAALGARLERQGR